MNKVEEIKPILYESFLSSQKVDGGSPDSNPHPNNISKLNQCDSTQEVLHVDKDSTTRDYVSYPAVADSWWRCDEDEDDVRKDEHVEHEESSFGELGYSDQKQGVLRFEDSNPDSEHTKLETIHSTEDTYTLSTYHTSITKPSVPLEITNNLSTPRKIYIYGDIISTFANASDLNTSINKETCGVLGGILKNNVFMLTHLIIPKQTGTSDTCAVTDEVGLWAYLSENNLITLGWIHTHPSQSCFMSSVDLHTHFPFQLSKSAYVLLLL